MSQWTVKRYVKRNGSVVRGYSRALAAGSGAYVKQAFVDKLKTKYNAGFNKMKRQGFDFNGFILRTVRRARSKR